MIAEAFLISALSAQPLGASGYQISPRLYSMTVEEEENMMRWFVWKRHPNAEVVFTDEDRAPGVGFEKLPIRWRGKFVWFRRKPIGMQMEAIGASA